MSILLAHRSLSHSVNHLWIFAVLICGLQLGCQTNREKSTGGDNPRNGTNREPDHVTETLKSIEGAEVWIRHDPVIDSWQAIDTYFMPTIPEHAQYLDMCISQGASNDCSLRQIALGGIRAINSALIRDRQGDPTAHLLWELPNTTSEIASSRKQILKESGLPESVSLQSVFSLKEGASIQFEDFEITIEGGDSIRAQVKQVLSKTNSEEVRTSFSEYALEVLGPTEIYDTLVQAMDREVSLSVRFVLKVSEHKIRYEFKIIEDGSVHFVSSQILP